MLWNVLFLPRHMKSTNTAQCRCLDFLLCVLFHHQCALEQGFRTSSEVWLSSQSVNGKASEYQIYIKFRQLHIEHFWKRYDKFIQNWPRIWKWIDLTSWMFYPPPTKCKLQLPFMVNNAPHSNAPQKIIVYFSTNLFSYAWACTIDFAQKAITIVRLLQNMQ